MTRWSCCDAFFFCMVYWCGHGCRTYSHLRWVWIFLVNSIWCFETISSTLVKFIKREATFADVWIGAFMFAKRKRKKNKMSPHLHGPLKPSSDRAPGVPLAFFAIWSRFVSLRCPPDPRVPEVGVILLYHLVPLPGWHQLPLSNRNRMEQSYELPAAAAIDASGKHLDPSIHRSLPLRCCSTRSSDT